MINDDNRDRRTGKISATSISDLEIRGVMPPSSKKITVRSGSAWPRFDTATGQASAARDRNGTPSRAIRPFIGNGDRANEFPPFLIAATTPRCDQTKTSLSRGASSSIEIHRTDRDTKGKAMSVVDAVLTTIFLRALLRNSRSRTVQVIDRRKRKGGERFYN